MSGWLRVNRERRCPLCDHADWCLIALDGTAAICPRTPGDQRIGDAGWLHRMDGATTKLIASTTNTLPSIPRLSSEELIRLIGQFQRDISTRRLDILSRRLGVTTANLRQLNVGWAWNHQAFAFPMRQPNGSVCGVRLRTLSGRKFCVPGSTTGLFIPRNLQPTDDPLICEGESDTAAMLDLRFAVVGRPGCSNGTALLVEFVKLNRPTNVTVLADPGEPGQRGAAALASVLAAHAPIVRVISPPPGISDARDWKLHGATRDDILTAIKAAPPVKLRISTTVHTRERQRRRQFAHIH